jgi:NhaA family Na+:H+ antiporter
MSVDASKLLKSPLSHGVTWAHIFWASMLGEIGFTMSIFISGLSSSDPELLELSKFGIVGCSLVSGMLGLTFLSIITSRQDANS